jgi:hypothetical protein
MLELAWGRLADIGGMEGQRGPTNRGPSWDWWAVRSGITATLGVLIMYWGQWWGFALLAVGVWGGKRSYDRYRSRDSA